MATTKVRGELVDLNATGADKGLKMPSGTEFNRPSNTNGSIRNNTNETSETSASAQEYYNGTEWKKITNVNPIPLSNIITVTDTQKFDRAQTAPTNNTRYTYSFWVKWTSFGTGRNMFIGTGQYSSVPRESIQWDNATSYWFYYYDGGASNQGAYLGPVISAPTAGVWYHYVLQKEAQQFPVLYVNGQSLGLFVSNTYPSIPTGDGTATRINSGSDQHRINGPQWATDQGLNASFAYCQFVDGAIVPPSSFVTSISGEIAPASYSGSWGNNGWQLLFANTGAIGTDTSGNGNNFSTVPSATTGSEIVKYSPIPATGSMSYTLIAGGGGGGTALGDGAGGIGGGGAGAGGFRTSYGYVSGALSSIETDLTLASGTYTIVVGAGGTGNTTGGDSSITDPGATTLTSVGGGDGGDRFGLGGTGGSGGANATDSTGGGTTNAGTANQGFESGPTRTSALTRCSSGGGGTGGAGYGASASAGGDGGKGQANGITGTSVVYAGGGAGGGGGTTGQTGGIGGSGVGGNGGNTSGGAGGNGTVNTGSGGGGAGGGTGAGTTGTGGSGVVLLRLKTAEYSGTTTGSPTVTTDGDYTILKFTGSGTYVH